MLGDVGFGAAGRLDHLTDVLYQSVFERITDLPGITEIFPAHGSGSLCGSGYRASIAASFLQRSGLDNVSNVVGGISAWKAAKLPTV